LDGGDGRKAVELIVDGLQETLGALDRLPEEVRKMMIENGRTVGELRAEPPAFTAEEAQRIACRTLIISGESSPLWLRRIAELLGRSIPNAAVEAIPGTRHFPHVENPLEFNRRVLQFLAESGSPS
jgi:pimeloyl-ACP methyl ester carboxylesterase